MGEWKHFTWCSCPGDTRLHVHRPFKNSTTSPKERLYKAGLETKGNIQKEKNLSRFLQSHTWTLIPNCLSLWYLKPSGISLHFSWPGGSPVLTLYFRWPLTVLNSGSSLCFKWVGKGNMYGNYSVHAGIPSFMWLSMDSGL